jgi:hypothetical protein
MFSWRYKNNIPLAFLREPGKFEDCIERLLPWDIDEPYRNGALHRAARQDIDTPGLCQQPQDIPHIGTLDIK